MSGARLTSIESLGVTLLGDWRRPGGVTFAFTERTGGVSPQPFDSLNLGDRCGDDEACVRRNRARALAALGGEGLLRRLVNPLQVHGTNVVVVDDGTDEGVEEARRQAQEGADAIVCTVNDVPVLLCYADCVPVVLTAPGAFAVVHSGWRGTIERISAKALRVLCEASGAAVADVRAYMGPHVGVADYEVSVELAQRFVAEFGEGACQPGNHLDLGFCVAQALHDAGVSADALASCDVSTASATNRFFSYRASGGTCGRHGALAFIPGGAKGEV